MTRTGKIGRLPAPVREALNELLYKGDQGPGLLEWLNGLPETQEVLKHDFASRQISKQNLSDWRRTGYADWVARRELMEDARKLLADGRELNSLDLADGALGDYLATVLMVKSSRLLSEWQVSADEGFDLKVRSLRRLCMNVAQLRRGDHSAGKLKLAEGRAALETVDELKKAYMGVAARAMVFPEVEKAFRAAFDLLKKTEEEEKAMEEKAWAEAREQQAAQEEEERQTRERDQARWEEYKRTGQWPNVLDVAEGKEKQEKNGVVAPSMPDQSSAVKASPEK